jgi:HEAT repeat protein
MRLARLAEDGRMTVRDGRLTITCNRPRTVNDVVDVVENAVDLFERMTWSVPIDHRLFDNFETDRDPHVRERLFKMILAEGSEPIRQRAIRKAVEDLNPEVRLLAVKALKAGGWEEAVALYRDRKVVSRYRADALRHLALTFGRERALPLVEEGLSHKSPEICSMAVEAIGGWRHAASVGKLEGLQSREPPVLERVATALGRIGGLNAQRVLIDLLRSEHRGVRHSAIDALGRAGNLDAIVELARIKDFGLKASVREAIGAIQARCGREAEGALSLAAESTQEGAVSLSVSPGAVSVANTSGREK